MSNGNFKVKCLDNVGHSLYTVGKVYEIIDGKFIADDNCNCGDHFHTFNDLVEWSSAKWELINEEKKPVREIITIRRKKKAVVATITDGVNTYSQFTKLSDASGDFKTAVKMVIERLMDKWKVENKTDGNFKAKCISDGHDSGLTNGKVYEFIDGYGKWNNGTKMPQFENCGVSRFGSFSDLLKWFSDDESYKWEEVKDGTPLTADGFRIVKQDKYEVGDTVKVREDLKVNKPYGGNAFIRDMTPWLGEMVKLENKFTDGFSIEGDTNPLKYRWTPEMFEGKVIETAVKTASNVSLEINGKPVLSCDCDNDGNLETSFDWSGFKQGKSAVHCDTEEKAKEFLKECDVHGIKWSSGDIASSKNYFTDYLKNTCYRVPYKSGLNVASVDYYEGENITVIDYTPSKPAVKEVKRKAEVGEWIKIVDGCGCALTKIGDIAQVTRVWYGNDGVDYKTPDGIEGSGFHKRYVVLEGYVPEDKPTVKEVKRHAKVGEWIKLTCTTYSFNRVGDILPVCFSGNCHVSVHGNKHPRSTGYLEQDWHYLNESYIVLENYQPEEPRAAIKEELKVDTTQKPFVKAKVGDKIKVVNEKPKGRMWKNKSDDDLTITQVDSDGVWSRNRNFYYDKDAEYIILDSPSNNPVNKPLSEYTNRELSAELLRRYEQEGK